MQKNNQKHKIQHKQLPIEKRQQLAIYADKYGINKAALKFDVHFDTAKRWHSKFINGEDLINSNATPLSNIDFDKLDSYKKYINDMSLEMLKNKFDLPYSIDVMSNYYYSQNVPRKFKLLKIYKCSNCHSQFRAIYVYWGKPKNISCPFCHHKNLLRQNLFHIPFLNPKVDDYYFEQNKLYHINTQNFKEYAKPLLAVPKYIKCLFLFTTIPRKQSKVHLIRNFEKNNGNIVPVTYCKIEYSEISKRKIMNPRYDEIKTDLICQSCQSKYIEKYSKSGDEYPEIVNNDTDPLEEAIKLFILANKFNNKIAQTLMGISKKKFYRLKNRFFKEYLRIKNYSQYLK